MSFEKYPKVLHEKKRTKVSFWFGFVLFVIGFTAVLFSLNIYNPNIVPNKLRVMSLNNKLNILLLGCDEIFPEDDSKGSHWKGRSDTIILSSCNPYKNTLNILNIPRDTKIRVPGHGVEKINYLNTIGGPTFTKKYLEKLLKTHIDHYIIVNIQGLNKTIDEVGGIVIDVPQRMQYNDKAGMLNINLFPGKQLLNGEQATGFLRFRHDTLGDIGRIQRHQAFMRAVFKKLVDPIIFTKLPEIVSIYKKTIFTDLKPVEIIKIANFVRNVPEEKQNTVILPGEFGQYDEISYWIPKPKEIDKVIRKLFYDEKKFLSRFIKVNPKNVKISVLNGSKKDQFLATKLTKKLRKYGYTVLTIQDSDKHEKMTKIYAQKANPEVALQVKHDIDNFGELIIGNYGPPEADVTILAGDDLVNLNTKDKKKTIK